MSTIYPLHKVRVYNARTDQRFDLGSMVSVPRIGDMIDAPRMSRCRVDDVEWDFGYDDGLVTLIVEKQ